MYFEPVRHIHLTLYVRLVHTQPVLRQIRVYESTWCTRRCPLCAGQEQPHPMYSLPQPVLKDEYTDSVHYFCRWIWVTSWGIEEAINPFSHPTPQVYNFEI